MRVDFGPANLQPPERNNTSRTGQAGASTSQTEDSSNTTASGDLAQFSFNQARIHSLASHALASPEIRQAKVSALAQAIASGTYRLDPAKIADAITAEYNGAQQG
jgi:negative regulator of flagellin synthesis FlgM